MTDPFAALRSKVPLCSVLTIPATVAAVALWSVLMNAASEPVRQDAQRAPMRDFAGYWEETAATIRAAPPRVAPVRSPPVLFTAAEKLQLPSEPPLNLVQRWIAMMSDAAVTNAVAASEASPPLPVAPTASPTRSFAQVQHRAERPWHPELCAAHGLRRQYYYGGGSRYWRCAKTSRSPTPSTSVTLRAGMPTACGARTVAS